MTHSSVELLLAEIESYLVRNGISPTRFGVEAVNNRHIVFALRRGAQCTLRRADRIRAYMAANDKRRRRRSKSTAFLAA